MQDCCHFFACQPRKQPQSATFSSISDAESAKIQLSTAIDTVIETAAPQQALPATREDLRKASNILLDKIKSLHDDVLQGQPLPDAIYTTGGSAQSQMFHDALADWSPGIPIVGGHHMDGVASGLAI